MPPIITTAEASLKTLVITIQALTVKDKQMTLSVFRQLPEGSFYYDNNDPIPGTAWGTVRYPIKDKANRWVVHELDGILYRCEFPERESLHRDIVDKKRAQEVVQNFPEFKAHSWENEKATEERFQRHLEDKHKAEEELARATEFLRQELGFDAGRTILIRRLNALPQLFIAV